MEAAEALQGVENPYMLDTYGWALYRGGRTAEGVAALEKAVKAAPDLVDARFHLGVSLMETGQTVRGVEELKVIAIAAGAPAAMAAEARRLMAKQ
jgi:Flp pilus assembly protein TadD